MGFEFEDAELTYTVITNFGDDNLVVLYSGIDRETAEERTNFWDERQNTWLHVDRPAMDALSVAMRKFDALELYISGQADRVGRKGQFAGECYSIAPDNRHMLYYFGMDGRRVRV